MELEKTDETAGPPPGVLVSGHFDVGPGYHAHRARGRADWLLTYTLGGQGLYQQPDLSVLAGPGDLTLLTPGAYQDYSVPPGGAWEFWWAHFVPRPAWLPLLKLPITGRGLHRLTVASPAARARIAAAFRRLHRDALGSPPPWSEELALNALEEILLVAAGEEAGRPLFDPRVQRVLDLMARDLSAEHRIDALATAVFLSPSRLAHLFKEQTGQTLADALRELRLRQAARLLRHSGRSVQEVAAEVGFHCPFHFSRRFRQAFGASPREYRRQVQSGSGIAV